MKKIKGLMQFFGRGQKGFTLIELLVVVAILGILAAIAVPSVGVFIYDGKTEAQATELDNVQSAVTVAMTAAKSVTCVEVTSANRTKDMDNLGVDVNGDGSLVAADDCLVSEYMFGLGDGNVIKGEWVLFL